MTARLLSDLAYRGLKTATRVQIAAAGGVEAAARATRVGKSVLSDYQCVHRGDCFVPVDVLADLAAAGGVNPVLEDLAGLAGCVLVPVEALGDGAVGRDFALLGKEIAATFGDYAEAAPEGLTAGERQRLDRDLARVIAAAASLRGLLRGSG